MKDNDASTFYAGKRVAYIYRAEKSKSGSKFRAMWGKLTRTHGTNGLFRAKFKRNLPVSQQQHSATNKLHHYVGACFMWVYDSLKICYDQYLIHSYCSSIHLFALVTNNYVCVDYSHGILSPRILISKYCLNEISEKCLSCNYRG